MEPISLFITDPNQSNENKETNTMNNIAITNNNDYNKINTENTYTIQESTSKSETKSTKNNIESTTITTKINNDSKDKDLTESLTNSQSKTTSSDDEEKTDKIIIEQSIIPITFIKTEIPEEFIPVIINDKRNDKTLTLCIIFSVIGGIAILGVIIGYTIYYKKITANKINHQNTEINSLKKIQYYKIF